MLIAHGPPRRRPFTEFVWRHPEYWTVALSLGAWLVLAGRAVTHAHTHGLLAQWSHWLLMTAAMMLPLTTSAVRHTAERSLWPRRHRAILGFLVGYGAVWALAGAPLALLASVTRLPGQIGWASGAAIGFLLAAAWFLTPWKRLATSLCHRTIPLAPLGWRADRDCLRFGWNSGCYCAFNCWPFMLVCWLSAHSFLAMTGGFAFGWLERYRMPNHQIYAALLATLAAAFAVAQACS